MPELPEVEVVKLFLEPKLLHKTITKIEILSPKSFIGDSKKVINSEIVKFSRLGKQLSLHLSNHLILLIHLKMTGQLLYKSPLSKGDLEGLVMLGHPTSTINPKSTRLIFHFSDTSLRGGIPTKQSLLFFNDQRKFGWLRVFSSKELKLFQSDLGLDIFDPKFSPKYLYSQLQKSSRPIKAVLLDQHYFAGIGNIYACDALFLSGVHPQTPSNKISLKQAKLIHKFLIEIMLQSVLVGGSTAKDKTYIKPDGTTGQNQFFFRVYQKKGEPCLKCGTKIEYTKIGGRGTFFCPKCQAIP
jgi:formamidopyrimidine-DNA glycosylase